MIERFKEPQGLILLVEDDPNQVWFIRRAFAKLRIANPLDIVTNGQDAVLYMSDKGNRRPSLVLLDLQMPRLRGLKVLEWMRKQRDLRDVPVVVVTTSIEPEDRRRADTLGVLAYLCKPVSVEGVQELMDTLPTLHAVRQSP